MARKRKKYLVTTNSEAFACSLVTSPAVEESFVVFNSEKPLIEKFADEKKHLVTGVVAIPNKPIYRRNADGDEYDIVFSSEAIEKMAKDFLKEYRQHEVTLQHQENADGVYLVEQWIKKDMVYDKSLAVGLSKELPVGSWIQTYYVDSKDVWDRIESGELQGFSLECMLGLEEFEKQINIDKDMTIDEMSFWTKMREVLKEAFGKAEKKGDDPIEPIDIEDLAAQVEITNEELEEEKPIEAAPEVVESVEEPKPTDTPTEVEKPAEEAGNAVQQEPKKEEVNPHIEELINSLKEEINALKQMNTSLNDKVKEMSKEPSAKPISVNAKPNASDTYDAWREVMRSYMG